MTNKFSNDGILEILNILDEEECVQLALTTTQNLVKRDNIRDKNGIYYIGFCTFFY